MNHLKNTLGGGAMGIGSTLYVEGFIHTSPVDVLAGLGAMAIGFGLIVLGEEE